MKRNKKAERTTMARPACSLGHRIGDADPVPSIKLHREAVVGAIDPEIAEPDN